MFICTLNNPDTHYPDMTGQDYLGKWFTEGKCQYVTGQLEKGKDGTPHLQFFLHYKKENRQRITALKKHCKHAHFEAVKFNNGADDYCNKEDTRLDGPWTFGIKPARKNTKGDTARKTAEIIEMGPEKALEQGLVSLKDYERVVKSIDLYKLRTNKAVETDDVRGIWIYGPPGTGKSHFARKEYGDMFYLKPQSKWFDGYAGQETIILDDHDSPCLSHLLKLWTDKYAVNGEVKGHSIPLQHKRFIVTSNFTIEELYKD